MMRETDEADRATPCIHTALVDDQPIFRLGLRTLLDRDPGVAVMAEASNVEDALAEAGRILFDVAIVGMQPPITSGILLASELRRIQPGCKILGLSASAEPVWVAELLRAGASGVVMKTQPLGDIVDAVRQIATGARYLPPSMSPARVDDFLANAAVWPLDRLTRREREVFELLVAGHSNERIASELFVARRTIETHRQHIMRKLDVRSLLELARLAVVHGITPL